MDPKNAIMQKQSICSLRFTFWK